MRIAPSAVVVVLILSPAVLAQPGESPRAIDRDASKMVTDDCALARKLGKICVLDVPAEDVPGRTSVVDDVRVQVRGFDEPTSLIRLRRDFIFEIVKTAEDL